MTLTRDSDFAAYVPVVNRFDLLDGVVAALVAAEIDYSLTIIDNSPEGISRGLYPFPLTVARSFVPMTFTQSMNFELEDTARKEKKFCLHMHSDAIIPDGAIEKLLFTARDVDASGKKWSVIYTHYDVLCIYNPECYKAIGGFDTNFSAYFSDNDWYHRCDLAGWERINTGIEVGHIGSQTINSDPKLQFMNSQTFPLYSYYYSLKWGGEPGHEKYLFPFNREDLFGKGK